MKKSNRMNVMYLAAAILTLVVVPFGTYNVIQKQNSPQHQGYVDMECAHEYITTHIDQTDVVEHSKKACEVSFEQYVKLHDQRALAYQAKQ